MKHGAQLYVGCVPTFSDVVTAAAAAADDDNNNNNLRGKAWVLVW